ncbi:MAG: RHS repeat-associated core domain-containing protein, partial [Candidatus Thiodiazotropha endolucinida]
LISQTIPGILQSSYQHDPVGNITDWQDLLSTGQDQLFDYDALYRLTNASGAYGDFTYTYDATGNRLSLTLDGSTETYSYVPSSHRLQQILGSVTDSRTYDAAGNTIQSLIGSYTYDDTNRMVGFTKTGTAATYAYNGKGERISKNVDGTITRFRYAPAGQLLGEYDQTGQAIREYITLEGQPVAQIVTDPVTTLSSVYYLHTDHLGAVVKATNNTQALVWNAERKPFGQRTVTTAQIEMPLGFPGQYFDEESGSYYNYFRDYDPSTGRYLQSDPIGLGGGINTYAYVGNAPLKYVDPSGEALLNPASGAAAGSVFGPPGTAVGAALGTLAFVGSATWTAWEMSQAMNSSESMKRKKKGVEEWNKNPPKKPGLYTCRYVMYFPSDLCKSGDCPPWVTGRGYDVTLSGAMSQARTEAQDKIPSGCGHQHHGQMWCRSSGGPPFMP